MSLLDVSSFDEKRIFNTESADAIQDSLFSMPTISSSHTVLRYLTNGFSTASAQDTVQRKRFIQKQIIIKVITT